MTIQIDSAQNGFIVTSGPEGSETVQVAANAQEAVTLALKALGASFDAPVTPPPADHGQSNPAT